MNKQMKDAINHLYQVFSKYTVNPEIDGCPCCVHDNHKNLLLSKPLIELEHNELSRYASKAMTTWGTVEDYKHYLPRIFELSVKDDLRVGEHITFGKLECANWQDWEESEINALKKFFKVWWEYNLKESAYLNTYAMVELLKKLDCNEKLMEKWKISDKDKSLENFIEFVYDAEFNEILRGAYPYKDLNQNIRLALHQWIEDGISYLRDYQSNNNKLTKKIKDALFIYDDYQS